MYLLTQTLSIPRGRWWHGAQLYSDWAPIRANSFTKLYTGKAIASQFWVRARWGWGGHYHLSRDLTTPPHSFPLVLHDTHGYSSEAYPKEGCCYLLMEEGSVPTNITTANKEILWRRHLDALDTSLGTWGGYQLTFRGGGVIHYTSPSPKYSYRLCHLSSGALHRPSLRPHWSDGHWAFLIKDGLDITHIAGLVLGGGDIIDGDEDLIRAGSVVWGGPIPSPGARGGDQPHRLIRAPIWEGGVSSLSYWYLARVCI